MGVYILPTYFPMTQQTRWRRSISTTKSRWDGFQFFGAKVMNGVCLNLYANLYTHKHNDMRT